MDREPQILACSGVLYPPGDSPPEMVGAQLRQAMALAGAGRPKVCLIATAVLAAATLEMPWSTGDIRPGPWDVRLCPGSGPGSIVVR
jgi:hypothetical protein